MAAMSILEAVGVAGKHASPISSFTLLKNSSNPNHDQLPTKILRANTPHAAASIFGIFLLQFLSELWKIKHIPSAIPLPIVGHLYLPNAPLVMKFLAGMKRKYGPIFAFWSGNVPFVVVSDPKSVRQILTDTRTFVKGSDYSNKFAIVFGEGLVTSNGDRHKKVRSCLGKYFVRSGVERYLGFMNAQTKSMIEEIIRPAINQPLDVQEFFHVLALRVFGKFCADHDYSTDPLAGWINHEVSAGSNIIGEHIVLGLPVWDFIPRIKQLKKNVIKMHAHIEDIIQERLEKRKDPEYAEPEDCMKACLDENLPRNEIYEHFTTLLSAGHDTTAFFGCYMAYMLAMHPDKQQKVKDEIKEVMGDRDEVTNVDVKKLKYLTNCMKETLRMYTVIPFVNRTTTTDVKLRDANVILPKGTTALVPLCIMNRDRKVWENPNEFCPERFENLEISDNSAKHGFLPFGYGSRTCIGNTLALVEGAVMFTQLMRKIRFETVEGFKPKIAPGISLISKNGIKVRCVWEEE